MTMTCSGLCRAVTCGSTRRPKTGRCRPTRGAPCPAASPVELNAGDAVVYINYLLHWGSNYSPKTRRTIHGGHTIFPYYPDISFTEFLSPGARASFMQWNGKSAALQDLTEIALREALNGNAGAYYNALEALQPGVGEDGKMVLTIYLSKAVLHLQVVKHENGDSGADSDPLAGITEDYRQRARSSHSISINWGPQFADALHGGGGRGPPQTVCDPGRQTAGGGRAFRARFSGAADALLFQRDAGRFYPRGFYRQLELSPTVHPSTRPSPAPPTWRADPFPAARSCRPGRMPCCRRRRSGCDR